MARLPTVDELMSGFISAAPHVPAPTPGGMMDAPPPQMQDPLAGLPYGGSGLAPIGPPVPRTGFGQTAGSGFHPIAEALAAWGVNQQPGVWQDLARWAAPGVHQAERGARTIGRMAVEATGVPSAGRAGEAAARGDYVHALGQGLMALPSTVAGIPGALLASSADAQAPDPRVRRITDLQTDIKAREKRLQGFGNRQFPSARARADAVKVETDGIQAARDAVKALQDTMDAEAAQAAAAERARQAAAEWREMPFARAYPGAPAGIAGVGMMASMAIPYARTRAGVGAYNAQVNDLMTRWQAAIDRAKNASLAPKTRTAAANEARQMQTQFETLTTAGPRTGGHGRAFAEGAVPTELALGAPTAIDYLASMPGSDLRRYTLDSVNPIENPGDVLGRYGFGLGMGGAMGELGHFLGERGVQRPGGLAAETQALNKRYQAPRRRR